MREAKNRIFVVIDACVCVVSQFDRICIYIYIYINIYIYIYLMGRTNNDPAVDVTLV